MLILSSSRRYAACALQILLQSALFRLFKITKLASKNSVSFQNLNLNDLKVKAFQKAFESESVSTLYLPCNRHGLVPSVAENDTSRIRLQEVYLLLGRNFKHWKACLEYTKLQNADSNANVADLAPKEMRPLQKFQPLVVNSSEPNSRADTPKLASPPAVDSQELKNSDYR